MENLADTESTKYSKLTSSLKEKIHGPYLCDPLKIHIMSTDTKKFQENLILMIFYKVKSTTLA